MLSRKVFVSLLLILACAALLRWAYGVGQAKFIYEVRPLQEPVSIPVVYDYYSGRATRVDERRVKVAWGPVEPVTSSPHPVVTCLGIIPAGGDRSYILEIEGALYVERGAFIDPLIAALRHYERHGELPPELIEALNDPELKRDTLAEVLAGIAQEQ